MPTADIVVESKVEETFRVKQVAGMYDVPLNHKTKESWSVNLPVDDDEWRIGLIVGPSGSGKTTIGKTLFGENAYHKGFKWAKGKAMIDGFDKAISIKEICKTLTAVGFGSTPSWCKPFGVLSNGEKFRAELARVITNNKAITVLDEYTSVVDRVVAKIGSAAIRKAVWKREGKSKYVMLSCHYDIIKWLEPDWVYDLKNGQFTRRRLRRPKIDLQIYPATTKEWSTFKKHHYLSGNIHPSAKCYIGLVDGNPVAFVGVLPVPGKKGMRRESRLVVLPEYQGVGIGKTMSNEVAAIWKNNGCRYVSTTGHPAIIAYRKNSLLWRITAILKSGSAKNIGLLLKTNYKGSTGRSVVSAEYMGKYA